MKLRLLLDPAVVDAAAAAPGVKADAVKASAEDALKAQNVKAMADPAAGQKVQDAAGAAALAAAEKAKSDAASKLIADTKAAQDRAAAEQKKALEDGGTPWDATKKEPTAEEKAAADAAAATAAKAKADAEKKTYELKAPEGVKMEAAALTKFAGEMQALGVPAEQAQKLLERDLAAQKAQEKSIQGQLKANDQAFVKALQSEWGDKFAENSEHVKRGFEDFDPTGKIRAGLKAAGLINWPEAVRAMERHGRRIAEDKLFNPAVGKAGDPKMSPEDKIKQQYAMKMAGQKG